MITSVPFFWWRALRPHQYAKNLLIFLPVLASHSRDPEKWLHTCLMFLCFCMAASATYLINDVSDVTADRAHPTKRNRPIASGKISPRAAVIVAMVLFTAALLLAGTINARSLLVLCGYVALTTLYTFYLKRQMLVDIVALALLYTIRVVAGGVASVVVLSDWLLTLSLFVFSCLALIKRHAELALLLDADLPDPVNRNYRKGDLIVLAALAAASGINAVTVLALYVGSQTVAQSYSHPRLLWLLCPVLLYLLSRALMMSHRREMHDDPVVWALKDRACLLCAAGAGAIVVLAL